MALWQAALLASQQRGWMSYDLRRDTQMDRRGQRRLAIQASRRYRARLFLLGLACGWPVVGAAQEVACPKEVPGFRIVCGVTVIGMRAVGGDPPGSTMGSVERCAASCIARRDCVAFAMINAATGHCFHYSGEVSRKPEVGYVSGFKS